MLPLLFSHVAASLVAQEEVDSFVYDLLEFQYKFPDTIPEAAQFHLIEAGTGGSITNIEANSLGSTAVIDPPSDSDDDYQDESLVPDSDPDYALSYSLCVLMDEIDDGDDVFDDYYCEPVDGGLQWGYFDADDLKEGHDHFDLDYDIANTADTQGGGPLYYTVSRESSVPSVDDVVAGRNSIVDGNGVIDITAGDTSDTEKVELREFDELLYDEVIYINTVLDTDGAGTYSNVFQKSFRVKEHDWGWELGVVVAVIVGACVGIALLVGCITMFGAVPGTALAVCACCAFGE